MKLIDLDRALDDIDLELYLTDAWHTAHYMLENQKEVDAIPLDWIEGWLFANEKDYFGSIYHAVMEKMIFDWRRYNGQARTLR